MGISLIDRFLMDLSATMHASQPTADALTTVQVHLLGSLTLDEFLRLQRSLVFSVEERPHLGALILCEHPPMLTVGRHGRPADLPALREHCNLRGGSVRWVSRGGGTILHLPGQLAIYPILAIERLGLDVPTYLHRLQRMLIDLLDDFGIRATAHPDQSSLRVSDRLIASVGIALRRQVTHFGAVLNVDPDLVLHRSILPDTEVTSLIRERHGPLRTAHVRQRLLEHFQSRFGLPDLDLRFAPLLRPGREADHIPR